MVDQNKRAPTVWPCLLLIYPRINVTLPNLFFGSKRFEYEITPQEIGDAINSFQHFPALVRDLTDGRVDIRFDQVEVDRTLSSLSKLAKRSWWPSPDDTGFELDRYEIGGRYHSVFVFWPQNNVLKGLRIPSGGWGLGMGASSWSRRATYATVANVPSQFWRLPMEGEVWLHEWLHGVCRFFQSRGYTMPDGDADGAERHGYIRSPKKGWTDYYRDLMKGRVLEDGMLKGIPPSAWEMAFSCEDV